MIGNNFRLIRIYKQNYFKHVRIIIINNKGLGEGMKNKKILLVFRHHLF